MTLTTSTATKNSKSQLNREARGVWNLKKLGQNVRDFRVMTGRPGRHCRPGCSLPLPESLQARRWCETRRTGPGVGNPAGPCGGPGPSPSHGPIRLSGHGPRCHCHGATARLRLSLSLGSESVAKLELQLQVPRARRVAESTSMACQVQLARQVAGPGPSLRPESLSEWTVGETRLGETH